VDQALVSRAHRRRVPGLNQGVAPGSPRGRRAPISLRVMTSAHRTIAPELNEEPMA
jgi:hypothetical protein